MCSVWMWSYFDGSIGGPTVYGVGELLTNFFFDRNPFLDWAIFLMMVSSEDGHNLAALAYVIPGQEE